MQYEVFISYASDDKPTADAVCAFLESRKLRCWYAPRDIPPGDEWGSAIVSAIGQAGVFVLVMTAQSNISQFVRREVERAVSAGKPVLPLRIEDIEPSQGLELFVSATHWLDAMSPPLERHLEVLAARVRAILHNPSTPIPEDKQASGVSAAGLGNPVRLSHIQPKRLSIAGLVLSGIAAACVLGLAIWAMNSRTHPQPQQLAASSGQYLSESGGSEEIALPVEYSQETTEHKPAEADAPADADQAVPQADLVQPIEVSPNPAKEADPEPAELLENTPETSDKVQVAREPDLALIAPTVEPIPEGAAEDADIEPKKGPVDPERQRLIEKAQAAEVQAKLRPFLDKGSWQPGIPNSNPSGEITPMSLRAIRQHGALETDDQGLKQLLSIANLKGCRGAKLPRTHAQNGKPYDRDRLKWTFTDRFLSLTSEDVSQIREAQNLLIELGDVLVELELLSP